MRIINFLKSRLRKFLLEEIWIEDYIKLGMKIGTNCSIQPGVVFDYSHCWLIRIGNNVTIAPQAYILAHDASTKKDTNFTKIGSVTIEDNVFIGARSLVLPGVTIGRNSVIAAGSVVTKSIPPGMIAGGNPAKIISTVQQYIEKYSSIMGGNKKYDKSFTLRGGISNLDKAEMYTDLIDRIGFIE